MPNFTTALCQAVLQPRIVQTDTQRHFVRRAIADTLAVAAAGVPEEVTQKATLAYSGETSRTWWEAPVESREAAVMLNAIAAHALDFDDVYIESLAHVSAVLVPAILTDDSFPLEDIYQAYGAGVIAARAIGGILGQGHYNKGWHGTGTVGVFAATAAYGRLLNLTPKQLAHAFALAAGMSAGLQANFSTQAKPVQAGLAASSGYRAARLAKAGITGSDDIFADDAFVGLYRVGMVDCPPWEELFTFRPEQISVKLFPCCFAASRLVGLGLDARAKLGPEGYKSVNSVEIVVPKGSVAVLRYPRPKTGNEAKFSAEYAFATALINGVPTISDFSDHATRSAKVMALLDMITLKEDPHSDSQGDISFGRVGAELMTPQGRVDLSRSAAPGSIAEPATDEMLQAKIDGCLEAYVQFAHKDFPMVEFTKILG